MIFFGTLNVCLLHVLQAHSAHKLLPDLSNHRSRGKRPFVYMCDLWLGRVAEGGIKGSKGVFVPSFGGCWGPCHGGKSGAPCISSFERRHRPPPHSVPFRWRSSGWTPSPPGPPHPPLARRGRGTRTRTMTRCGRPWRSLQSSPAPRTSTTLLPFGLSCHECP